MSDPDDLMADWRPMPPSGGSYPVVVLTEAAYQQAIAAAVAAEREACAQDCERLSQHFGRHSEGWTAMLDAAIYIRARSAPPRNASVGEPAGERGV